MRASWRAHEPSEPSFPCGRPQANCMWAGGASAWGGGGGLEWKLRGLEGPREPPRAISRACTAAPGPGYLGRKEADSAGGWRGTGEGAVEKEARNQGEGLRRARKAHLLHPYLSAQAHTAHAVRTGAQVRMYGCTCPHAHKGAQRTHAHVYPHTGSMQHVHTDARTHTPHPQPARALPCPPTVRPVGSRPPRPGRCCSRPVRRPSHGQPCDLQCLVARRSLSQDLNSVSVLV